MDSVRVFFRTHAKDSGDPPSSDEDRESSRMSARHSGSHHTIISVNNRSPYPSNRRKELKRRMSERAKAVDCDTRASMDARATSESLIFDDYAESVPWHSMSSPILMQKLGSRKDGTLASFALGLCLCCFLLVLLLLALFSCFSANSGLTSREAAVRLAKYGPNMITPPKTTHW